MKNRILLLLLVSLLLVLTLVPVSALSEEPRLYDGADILTNSEENEILEKLNSVSKKHKFDLVVITTDDSYNMTPEEYAGTLYEASGYGYGESYDGMIFLITMGEEENDCFMYPNGLGETVFSYPCIEYILDKTVPSFADGYFADGLNTYIDQCDIFITQAKTGEPYGKGNLPEEPYNVFVNIVCGIILGFIIAFIATGIMKGKLKTVKGQINARNYLVEGSMKITNAKDIFLYKQVVRTAKPKNTSSSSSGGSYKGSSRGGGRKF